MKKSIKERLKSAAPSLVHNWISLGGIILALCSFFATACLIALDLFQESGNPYMGILTYIVAPAFLIAGLLMIAIGALWERRRLRHLKPGEVPEYPRLDLNDPRQRRHFVFITTVTIVLFFLTALGSYRTYQFTESVAFCGETCHKVMKPEFVSHQQSPHAHVACVQCHIGPGASWYVKSKISGAYQVYATLVNNYPRPIPVPIAHLRPVKLTCEQCHWPKRFFGAAERVWHHYLPDQTNTEWTVRMLLKIGGGDPAFGPVGGIHWHMSVANKIEYIATDTNLQDIPWVRLTDSQGHVTVYQSKDNKLTHAQIAKAKIHVMDCVDCHNRPTHIYHSPVYSVDLAMSTGRISPRIPYIKKEAVQALTGKYKTADLAKQGIAKSLTTYYQSNYPGFARTNSDMLNKAIAQLKTIYSHNFFPSMKVNWRTYADNIGHMNFDGCYRCHDGNHVSAAGKPITHDCDACHTIIAEGKGAAASSMSPQGLKFKHPVDIGGMWKTYNCDFCHQGAMVE